MTTNSSRADERPVVQDAPMGRPPTTSVPTGTVTFLLTDVESSTALWQEYQDDAAVAMARHHELLHAAVELHGGFRPPDQGEGDSIAAAFARPSDALAAALDIQRALLVEDWGTTTIRVRIGVHTGEASLRDDANYQGSAIIRSARLRNLAHGGQTLLSNTTHELVADRLPDGVSFRDLGTHHLKGLDRPERIWQLCHRELPDVFAALTSADALRSNLPTQLTSFVGRADELAQLETLLDDHRLVTLTGVGGCGKTRLAAEVAATIAPRRRDGACWVELATVRDPARITEAVGHALGLRWEREDTPDLVAFLGRYLERRDTCLVLDNCEQVLDGAAALVERLLLAAPDVLVVATSREPLGIAGEVAWRVPSMDATIAAALFCERAAQARPGFVPDDEQQATIERICGRLDGIPLAIELAAARMRTTDPGRIASGLDDRFRLLTGGTRTATPRQQTLEASVAWSHDLLDDAERIALRRLSVFAGGFAVESAEAVLPDERVERYGVLDLVSRLVDKSLVQLAEDGRYSMLETIRQYARDRLVESGEAAALSERHFEHFRALAALAAPELMRGGGVAWLDRLDAEHDNLQAAMDWAEAATPVPDDRLLAMMTDLTLFWELRGHLGLADERFTRVLGAVDGEASVARARALWAAAHVNVYYGDKPAAARLAPEGLAMAEAVGDEVAAARLLNAWGYAELFADPAGARSHLAASVELGRRLGDDWAVADGLKMITLSWLTQARYDDLDEMLPELLIVAEGLDNAFFTSWYHVCVGFGALHRGRLDLAQSELELAIRECQGVGDPATAGIAIALLAELEGMTGAYEAADRRLTAFLDRGTSSGAAAGAGFAALQLGTLLTRRGDPASGHALLAWFAGNARDDGVMLWLSSALLSCAEANLALDEHDLAVDQVREARTIAVSLDNPWTRARADHLLGSLARRRGELGEAEDHHHRALAARASAGLVPDLTESLEALGGLALERESAVEAVRLLGAAAALRSDMGTVRWPDEQRTFDADVAGAAEVLGDEAFAAAWDEGSTLSADDAAAYAARARGERGRPSLGWDSLTPAESRVVALAAEGLTNKAIAERLFVTPGTVKVHLGHVFSKLGVSTRAELAAAATRRSVQLTDQ